MRTIYYVSSEKEGEIEGMFDENEELLDFWSSNDGTWRNEYFSQFMRELGINVEDEWKSERYARLKTKLEKEARERWG